MPLPYRVDRSPNGTIDIVHAYFDARVPRFYSNMKDAQLALAEILVSGQVRGTESAPGNCSYYGQPLVLRLPMDLSSLKRVDHFSFLRAPEKPDQDVYALELPPFTPGFEPITRHGHEYLRSLVTECNHTRICVKAAVRRIEPSQLALLFLRIDMAPLNIRAPTFEYPDLDVDDLRTAYPELEALADHALLDAYAGFSDGREDDPGEPVTRDAYFLYHVLGMRAGGPESMPKLETGQAVAVTLTNGRWDKMAFEYGRAHAAHELALRRIVDRAGIALAFLRQTPPGPTRGHEVLTATDMIEAGRSRPTAPAMAGVRYGRAEVVDTHALGVRSGFVPYPGVG